MKRRDFLRTGGAIIVSFAFDGALPNTSSAQISDLGKPVDRAKSTASLRFTETAP